MTNSFDLKIKKVFYPRDYLHLLSKKQLLDIVKNGFIDYWLASKFICEKLGGKLPTMVDLGKIASAIYEGNPTIGAKEDKYNLTYKPGTATSLGFPELSFILWSSEEYGSGNACYRNFIPTYTAWNGSDRYHSTIQAVCLGD